MVVQGCNPAPKRLTFNNCPDVCPGIIYAVGNFILLQVFCKTDWFVTFFNNPHIKIIRFLDIRSRDFKPISLDVFVDFFEQFIVIKIHL